MCTVALTLEILAQSRDTPLGHGQQLCEILSRSDNWVRSYGPDTMWTDGQTDRLIDGPGNSSTISVYDIINIQLDSELWAQTRIFGICALWPWPLRYDRGSKSWHTLQNFQQTQFNASFFHHKLFKMLLHWHTFFNMCHTLKTRLNT